MNLITGVTCWLVALLAITAGDIGWGIVVGCSAIWNFYYWLSPEQ